MASKGLERENTVLKRRIQELEAELAAARTPSTQSSNKQPQEDNACNGKLEQEFPLSLDEYKRYGRQMIMPEIGFQGPFLVIPFSHSQSLTQAGQLRLKHAKVLIVGAGGLGCPAAAYLAGAGVGAIGIIDHDTVEHSNLHRQIIHATSRVGVSKVESAITYLREYIPSTTRLPCS